MLGRLKTFIRGFLRPKTQFYQKCYSQDGEDGLLLSFLCDRKEGFYIDIGAHHPMRFSNTYLFYKKGWCGINIDATPGSMKAFNKIRERDINVEAGIGDSYGELDYYSFCEPALNSFDKELSNERIKNGWKLKRQGGVIQVKVFPINDVLNKYMPKNRHIDFITIDIEGFDLVVLSSWDFEKYAPDFFVIEDVEFNGKDIKEVCENSRVYKLMIQKSYICVGRTMRTLIFKKSLHIKQ